MDWYKKAQTADFATRNLLNTKIDYFKDLIEYIEKMSKVIFQSASLAKNSNSNILSNKKISSYPVIESILFEADDILYDSPWKFQFLCQEAIVESQKMLTGFIQDREDITDNKPNEFKKGWF
jgi:hypothetical protein